MTPDSSTHIIEDEVHFTKICPSYNHLRENFSCELSHKITNEEFNSIFESSALANEISKFIFLASKHRDKLIKAREIT